MARTIIVGDVHGCAAELEQLLERVGATETDRIVFVGDIIARGPDSVGVLRLFRLFRARSVVGNHEQRMLKVRAARAVGQRGPRLGPAHFRLLHQLSEADWSLIRSFPLYLDLPEHGLRVVHAGVHPSRSFEQQDPWTLTHIRSLTTDGRASERAGPVSWAEHYRCGPHIVFGHNSRLQLQLQHNATGLDTGCVYGAELSCLVLEENQPVPDDPAERASLIHSVVARRRYYAGVSQPPVSRAS